MREDLINMILEIVTLQDGFENNMHDKFVRKAW